MTFSEIKQHALRQLDEDPHDMHEYNDLLGVYINEGYQTALMDYAHPREEYVLSTDKEGDVDIYGLNIVKIVQVTETPHGYNAWATQDALGHTLHTAVRNGKVKVIALVSYPDMKEETEEPRLPEWAHAALADYACFRHLANGNMAKQSRAQFYYNQYLTTMRRIMPQGMGSVTGFKNLYTATDARFVR